MHVVWNIRLCHFNTLKFVFIQRESASINTQFHLKFNKILSLFQPNSAAFQKSEIVSSLFKVSRKINSLVSWSSRKAVFCPFLFSSLLLFAWLQHPWSLASQRSHRRWPSSWGPGIFAGRRNHRKPRYHNILGKRTGNYVDSDEKKNLVMKGFEGLIQNPLKQIRSSPSSNFSWLPFAALIFPSSGTLWVETTFYSDFHFDPIFLQPLRSPRKWQTTLQSWGEHLRDLRGQTCRAASPPSYTVCSPQNFFLARADSLSFACCSLCHEVCLPSRSKDPHMATCAVGGRGPCQSLSCVGIIKVQPSWEWKPGGVAGVDFMARYKWRLQTVRSHMFLRETFPSSKCCSRLSKSVSSCTLGRTCHKIAKMQQTWRELRHCTGIAEDCSTGLPWSKTPFTASERLWVESNRLSALVGMTRGKIFSLFL